ncbi:MAG: DUF1576 domain-containing protein [Tissierellia bacterium]|nr:DUF1576 domain-containing protein [Tissierellia bacterium]
MRDNVCKKQAILSEENLNYFVLSAIPILLIMLGFLVDTPREVLHGLYKIILNRDVLLVDYLAIGGMGATFINAGLTTLFCIIIMYVSNTPITGPLIAAVITVLGFSFMGKNIVNVWPIFIGGFIYAKYKKLELKNVLVPVFFITTLAPVVTEIALGLKLNYMISIPLAIIVGILIGFVVTPMAGHMSKFHDGYNLYNIGFTGGVLGTLIASLLRGFGFILETQSILSTEYSIYMRNILIIISLLYILFGFLINRNSFNGYLNIFKHSGRFLTDFIDRFGFGLALINMGIMGLISVLYVILVMGVFNGPVVAGIITVIAFSAFGKNPINSIPIFIGVYIAASLKIFDVASTSMIIAALFGTTLAPIAGAYGTIAGVLAGFLHVSIVSNIISVHGGLSLYNNGFSGGIVAAIMAPILNTFFKRKRE